MVEPPAQQSYRTWPKSLRFWGRVSRQTLGKDDWIFSNHSFCNSASAISSRYRAYAFGMASVSSLSRGEAGRVRMPGIAEGDNHNALQQVGARAYQHVAALRRSRDPVPLVDSKARTGKPGAAEVTERWAPELASPPMVPTRPTPSGGSCGHPPSPTSAFSGKWAVSHRSPRWSSDTRSCVRAVRPDRQKSSHAVLVLKGGEHLKS